MERSIAERGECFTPARMLEATCEGRFVSFCNNKITSFICMTLEGMTFIPK